MSAQVEVSVEGRLGVLALNRPEAINALNAGMIATITETLTAWADDPGIAAVLFEARGSRGFCAGGDVRTVRQAVISGEKPVADAFFRDEYRMNGLIAGFDKPVIAMADGVVMGGGIGIAGHADFRFTTPNARFAMPEAAIGFVCDVGVNRILAKAPVQRALLFEMSGLAVGAADALALGLSDCAVAPERWGEVRASIVAAAASTRVESALVGLMEAESIQAGDRGLCDLADRLRDEFGLPDAAQVVAAIAGRAADEPDFADIAKTLAARSPTSLEAILQSHRAARRAAGIGAPTSLEAILQSHRAARRAAGIGAVLALDLRLAILLSGLPDFAEGVRAVLVDKDQRPVWQPEPPIEKIRAAIGG